MPPRTPRGLYLHGRVGTGKTLLMDLFFSSVESRHKRRVHLHGFMLEIHARIHAWKGTERDRLLRELAAQPQAPGAPAPRLPTAESDGIAAVARSMAREHHLLAFDEFVVSDVVDALILKHLFSVLWAEGTVVVATSNTAPQELYRGGLNYPYFAPFIPMLLAQCKVFDMDSATDYRLRIAAEDAASGHVARRVLCPASPATRAEFQRTFAALCGPLGPQPGGRTIAVAFGRSLQVAACSRPDAPTQVAAFAFDLLCSDREPVLGTPDFVALCETFDTIMVHDVPVLGQGNHNEARRFITLVDQMYDRGVNIVLLAARPPLELFDSSEALGAKDAVHYKGLLSLVEINTAALRMASRLTEMATAPLRV